VPQIDVVDARPVRRSLAVSIDPALEYQMPGARLQETGAVLEFLNNWGASDTSPEMAFRLNGNAGEWSLITRARRAETSGDQNVSWSFNAQTAEVQLDAQLTTAAGSVFQYRLKAPPTLHVDSIAVLAGGANQAARWSQEADGHVTVFLKAPVSGRHEFHLRGQMPLTKNRDLPLPQVRLEEAQIQNSLVSLYRSRDVLVEVSGGAGLADVKTTADGPQSTGYPGGDRGRPVRSFYADMASGASGGSPLVGAGRGSPVLVTIRANHPRVRAEQWTRIACADGQWRTTCEYSLQVSEGLLDAIELEIPASWQKSLKTIPAMAAAFAARSDERVRLVLSPSAAISGNFAFTLIGPPPPTSGYPASGHPATRFAVAHVTLKNVPNVKQYVVLPNAADQRPVAWKLQKLRSRHPQAGTRKEAPAGETVEYDVIGEPWSAELLPPQKTTAGTPGTSSGRGSRIKQADVRYAWQADGRCLGAVFFDVETAGAIDCPLELPEGFDLLQFSVDGLPVDAVHDTAGTWIVPLASQASVSRVEVLCFAESAMAPVASGWPRRCSFRAPKLGDLPVERTAWTVASPHTLQPAIADGGQDPSPPSPSGATVTGDIAAQWQQFVEEGHAAVFHTADGPVDAITLEYRPIAAQSWLSRLAGIAVFLVVVGLAALLVRRRLLWKWFARWPYVFGVGIGLIWWLWLVPSAVGLLIVLAVLLRRFLPWRRFVRP
jgi:hypothetical protein